VPLEGQAAYSDPEITLASFQAHPPRPLDILPPSNHGEGKDGHRNIKRRPDRSNVISKAAPEQAKNMSSSERYQLKRILKRSAERVQLTQWKSLDPLPTFDSDLGLDLLEFIDGYWAWQDSCLKIMKDFREKTSKKYDYSSFEDAFGGTARLRGLYGKEAVECAKRLSGRSSAQS
jgi:hypothetical protein